MNKEIAKRIIGELKELAFARIVKDHLEPDKIYIHLSNLADSICRIKEGL